MWPFKRKPKMPPINEDWAVGDVAVSLLDMSAVEGPKRGEFCIVEYVEPSILIGTGEPAWQLSLAEYPMPVSPRGCVYGFNAEFFRKPRPNEIEARRSWQQMLDRAPEYSCEWL